MTRFYQAREMYPALKIHGGMKELLRKFTDRDGAYRTHSESVLADSGMLPVMMQVTREGHVMPVRIMSKAQAAREASRTKAGLVYRVQVKCDCCNEWIPFGKMGQHYQSRRCLQRTGSATCVRGAK